MSQYSATAVIARWSQRMNCTFKAVEDVRYSAERDLKGLVVAVAANFTGFHRSLLEKTQPGVREVFARTVQT
jgi:hypothetical protein